MIIIPDIHGRDFWRDAVKKRSQSEEVVFLGDYTDPYPEERIDKKVIPGTIKDILEFKKSDPGRVILLLGNHDLSYVMHRLPRCRFDTYRRLEIQNLFEDNRDLFQLGYVSGKYVFSHSGIHPSWILQQENYFKDGLDFSKIISQLNKSWWENDPELFKVLDDVSYERGGWFPDIMGSCIWGDVREFGMLSSEKPGWDIEKHYQIFGHTRAYDAIIEPGWAMLDANGKCAYKLNEQDGSIEELL